jgi:hypothetical protein
MRNIQTKPEEACPFRFNFDSATFAVGDTVSYRVEALGDFPFVGTLLEVHEDHVILSENDPRDLNRRIRATRESRPLVTRADIFG